MTPPPPAGALSRWLSALLSWGTIVAVGLVLVGVLFDLASGSQRPSGTSGNMLEVLGAGGPASIVAAGLLALGVLPMAALAVAAVVFAQSRERRHAVISAVVLALLLAGLAAAILASRPGGG